MNIRKRSGRTSGAKPASKSARTRASKQPAISPEVLRELRDGAVGTELHGIRRKLELIQSCVRVVGAALRDQNCELDSNTADILDTHVTDVLHIQLMKIDRLLGRKVHKDDIEEDEDTAGSIMSMGVRHE